jgi:hypothetical protein
MANEKETQREKYTKLQVILKKEKISQVKLHDKIQENVIRARPTLMMPISKPEICRIVKGNKSNIWIVKYIKILDAINDICNDKEGSTGKAYTLDDIIDPQLVKNEIDRPIVEFKTKK